METFYIESENVEDEVYYQASKLDKNKRIIDVLIAERGSSKGKGVCYYKKDGIIDEFSFIYYKR